MTSKVVLAWDDLDTLSREEIALSAGFRTTIACKKWEDIDSWIRDDLVSGLVRRSNGRVSLRTTNSYETVGA